MMMMMQIQFVSASRFFDLMTDFPVQKLKFMFQEKRFKVLKKDKTNALDIGRGN